MDNVRFCMDSKKADLYTKLIGNIITAAEQQTMNFYMNMANMYKNDLGRKLFAEIGDDPNIIQSLSTFSSHIKNIKEILDNADEETFILIDEIAPNWLSQIVTKGKELRRYKIHHIG